MRNYSWGYGIFHWFVHVTLTVVLVLISGISIFPNYSFSVWGTNLFDIIFAIIFSSLIDLDHLLVLLKLGPKYFILAQKKIPSPLHNFFFLFIFSFISLLSGLFISRVLAVLILSIVLHMIWDLLEDFLIFRINDGRWWKIFDTHAKEIEKLDSEIKRSSK
jgi:hypothetical protein